MAILSALFLDPQATESHYQLSLVCHDLPLPEHRVSGCKWNFVHWPFKEALCVSGISPQWPEMPLLFTVGCYLGSFPNSSAGFLSQVGELSWGFRPHTSQWNPMAVEISFQNFSGLPPPHWNLVSPLASPPLFPPVSW